MLFICTVVLPLKRQVHARNAPTAAQPSHFETLHPHGRLEAVQIPLADPTSTFADRDQRLRKPQWIFEGYSEAALKTFLERCYLEPREASLLCDKSNWSISSNGCIINPPDQVIWGLNPIGRSQIYSVLGQNLRNYPQFFPFRFALPNSFAEKFKDSGISARHLEKLKSLTYTNSGSLCFSDVYTAHNYLDPAEFNQFAEVLCAVPAYLLRLHLDADCNLDEVIRYWGRGGREKMIAPLLSSIARVPGGSAINVSYLLPTFARLRVYTYPGAWEVQNPEMQDCVFTALNFFNDFPNTNLFNRSEQARVMNSEYLVVKGEPTLGDLVNLLNADNEVFHSCVYITEGFVFTKNGSNPSQPWILMKLADMLAMYDSLEKPKTVVYLRRKDFAIAASR